jgi:hypothetical protein
VHDRLVIDDAQFVLTEGPTFVVDLARDSICSVAQASDQVARVTLSAF